MSEPAPAKAGVAVTLSLANRDASLPVAYRLYLPEDWAKDQARRHKAKVPEPIAFQTKPEIALEQINAAQAAGLPQGVVLMDAGYGNDTRLRTEITARGISYVAGDRPQHLGLATGRRPIAAADRIGARPTTDAASTRRGAPADLGQSLPRRRPGALALSLPQETWQTVRWREGSADWLASRFARLRVRPAHRDNLLAEPRAEEWLLIERPQDETEPTKYWFVSLAEDIAFDRLVDLAKLRWRIERDYQELKQELGLGDYEGRGWRGFHHHATLCIAAYGFLIAERGAIPPSGPGFAAPLSGSAIPDGYRPRGAADPPRTPHPKLDRDHATTPHCRSRQDPPEMSLLQYANPQDGKNSRFLT